MLFDTLPEQPEPKSESTFSQEARRVAGEDLATRIYTRGATGDPKGVKIWR